MERDEVLKVFQSLASSLRLDLFCRLVHSGEGGVVAGDLAREFAIPATNLSFHLRDMLVAGLVTVEAQGRFQRYRANVSQMLRVLAFIAAHCAQPDARSCVPAKGDRPAPARKARKSKRPEGEARRTRAAT